MGNKNSTQYHPQQIVDHLRQQYPQLNNEQLMQLYTRLYLRNNKMTPDNIDHTTRAHLEQIQQIIYYQSQSHNPINSFSQNYSNEYQDRPEMSYQFKNQHQQQLNSQFHQARQERGAQNYSNDYQPRNISNFQSKPTRKQMEEDYQQRFQQNNFSRVDPPQSKPSFNNISHSSENNRNRNSNRNSSRETKVNTELKSVNPQEAYRLFGLQPDFDLETLKKSYRKLALQTHPDRGGSPEKFKFVTRHYVFLMEEFKKNRPTLNFHDLKNSSQDFAQQQNQEPRRNIYFDGNTRNDNSDIDNSSGGSNFDNQRFNQLYDQHRLSTVHDEGYENWMIDHALDENDPEPMFSDKFNLDMFNNLFENDKDLNPQEQVIVYQEPAPTNIMRETGFSELGEDTIGDFSGEANSGLGYTDYKKAHTQTRLINTRQVEQRQSFNSVEHLERDRDKISYTMSPEDRQKEIEKKKHEQWLEQERVKRLGTQDQRYADNFERVNQLMVGLR